MPDLYLEDSLFKGAPPFKQGLRKLEEEEAKALSTRVVASPDLLVVPLLPLVNPFIFNPSLSLLPDLLFYNTP